MGLLSFIGGVVVFFYIIGLIFKFGGALIHLLLIVSVIMFLFDFIFGKKK